VCEGEPGIIHAMTRIAFLGGASGIGASCIYVELDGLRAVVDCGIRQARGETLPELATLRDALDGEAPDLFVLTHAHLDHSGALPVFHRHWPTVPIVATHATGELVRILLSDALKIMEFGRDEELPLYDRGEVERTLAALHTVGFDEPFEAGAGRVRLLPAGHILGAGMAVLEANGRQVMVSGDISIADQRTVAGMPVPRERPDTLVLESTYGDRMHASRSVEERRLVQQVAEAIEEGGHVLIPAFAVGRAQEVLLSLRAGQENREIEPFPVYADGMVRSVCGAYHHFASFLERKLRRRALHRRGNLFFSEEPSFEAVTTPDHRRKIIEGGPCCVVASSGMLAGGASPLYARAWAGEERSLIAITGYQDEEAPGRALLDLVGAKTRTLALPGGAVEVKARIARYQLSAHADADELAGLLQRLSPKRLYLVHGEGKAREALAARLSGVYRGDLALPEDGEIVSLEGSARRRRPKWEGAGIGDNRQIDEEALEELRRWALGVSEGRGRRFEIDELAHAWYGEGLREEQLAAVRTALEGAQDAFVPDARFAFRFRPRPDIAEGPSPATVVLEMVDRLLTPEESGLLKRSLHAAERRLVLRFDFPDVRGLAAEETIRVIEKTTGWELTIHPHANQERLCAVAQELLGDAAGQKAPSLLLDEKCLKLTVSEYSEEWRAEFLRRTGWTLQLEAGGEIASAKPSGGELSPQDARREALAAFEGVEPDLAPLKFSFPPGGIVLHFIHPGLAALHVERIEALAERTGRHLEAHPHPAQQKLIELATPLIPREWSALKPPAWVPQERALRVIVWSMPTSEEQERVQLLVRERTGCPLRVVEGE
jgi:uncharacterized protein